MAVAAVATADRNERSGAPALVEARQQALLIAALRGVLAVAGVGAAIARGVHPGRRSGWSIFGAALVLLSIYGGGRPARSAARFANPEPTPAEARMQGAWRGLAEAAYPSTIGLTALTAIALWPQPPLAAFLAGILAGLAVMSLVGLRAADAARARSPVADPDRLQGEPRLRDAAMTHDVIVILAALGVAGQVLAVLLLLVGLAWLFGLRGPGDWLRRALEGYELWCVFLVSSIATGGSLFFSEVAGFIPCELCWYQRICMYPLSIISLLAALAQRPPRGALPAAAAARRRGRLGLPPAGRERRRRAGQGVPDLGARRLRDEVDRGVRLRDDPDARADRLRALLRLPAAGLVAAAVCGYRSER